MLRKHKTLEEIALAKSIGRDNAWLSWAGLATLFRELRHNSVIISLKTHTACAGHKPSGRFSKKQISKLID